MVSTLEKTSSFSHVHPSIHLLSGNESYVQYVESWARWKLPSIRAPGFSWNANHRKISRVRKRFIICDTIPFVLLLIPPLLERFIGHYRHFRPLQFKNLGSESWRCKLEDGSSLALFFFSSFSWSKKSSSGSMKRGIPFFSLFLFLKFKTPLMFA